MSCMRSTVGVWLSACTIRFRKASLFGWCAALLLRIVVGPLCQISYWSRHRPVTIDILCSVGTVAFARFRCACLPLFGLFHNLEPSKLEGCRLALRRCVEARCQDVECFSTLSVLCLVIALSDCI